MFAIGTKVIANSPGPGKSGLGDSDHGFKDAEAFGTMPGRIVAGPVPHGPQMIYKIALDNGDVLWMNQAFVTARG